MKKGVVNKKKEKGSTCSTFTLLKYTQKLYNNLILVDSLAITRKSQNIINVKELLLDYIFVLQCLHPIQGELDDIDVFFLIDGDRGPCDEVYPLWHCVLFYQKPFQSQALE
ncbi:hypothetical protein ACJX0J_006946 [Zea mays]